MEPCGQDPSHQDHSHAVAGDHAVGDHADDPPGTELVSADDAHEHDDHRRRQPWWRHEHSHTFDPHDVRETSARFRHPCQRNFWVVNPDGTRVNSADSEKRGMPPYLLILDLVFAAVCGLCARTIKLHNLEGVPRFLMLYFAIVWIWSLINMRLNCYDPEDISFEVFILLCMVYSIMLCLHLDGCFLQDDPDVAAANQTSFWLEGGTVCFDFVLSEFMLRVVLPV